MEKPFTFAQRLQQLIDAKGITKSDLARSCGIAKSNITRYLNGEYEAKQDVIYRIAVKYGVSGAWLMGYDTPLLEEDPVLQKQHEEINELFDRLPPELRAHYLALLKGLAQASPAPDDPKGAD